MEERRSSVGARGRGARRGGNPSRRDVAPRCRRSEAGGCARTVLRAVLGVFARRCSPPSSAVRKGCGWIGGRRRRQAIVVGSLARVSRLGGGCVSASSRETGMSATRGRGTNLRRTLDAEHALGRECEERVRLIVPRRLPLHHRCAHRCCSRVYRLCPETRVAALFLEVRDDSGPKGGTELECWFHFLHIRCLICRLKNHTFIFNHLPPVFHRAAVVLPSARRPRDGASAPQLALSTTHPAGHVRTDMVRPSPPRLSRRLLHLDASRV